MDKYTNSPARIRAGFKFRKKKREAVLVKLGGKCKNCGFSDFRALHIDHINGGGTKENKNTSWLSRYNNILLGNFTGKYQLLCANCNFIKRYTNNEMLRISPSKDLV